MNQSNDRSTPRTEPATDRYRLKILATTDLHAQLMPYDYAWDRPLIGAGLTRTASLIRAARLEEPNSVLFDNGDFLEGFPFGDLADEISRKTGEDTHPVIAAMNALGYDAAGLGNHEFGFSLNDLERTLAAADFPVISTNISYTKGASPAGRAHFVPPIAVINREMIGTNGQRSQIRIGLLSFLPPQVDLWEARHIAGRLETQDILESAKVWIPRLKAEGADLIVALCHSGIGSALALDRMENAAVPLAALPGIDALITGHVHGVFPGADFSLPPEVDHVNGALCGKPTVMPGFWGSHLGVIDLNLSKDQAGWKVVSFSVAARPIAIRSDSGELIARVDDDPDLTAAIRPSHSAVLDHIRQPIGTTDTPLHSYFARLTDCPSLQLVRDAQRDWLEQALQGTAYASLPILSSASPFKSGGRSGPQFYTDIAQGDLLRRHVTDLYFFSNTFRALLISGATLKEWLERSAAQFCQLTPGVKDQPLFEPDSAAFNFDTIDGISYAFDLLAPSRYNERGHLVAPQAERVRDLSFMGRPIDANAHFVLATNSYRASGGGQFPGLEISPVIHKTETRISDILQNYIEQKHVLSPRATQRWRIMPPPVDTYAWFDTGPNAINHIADETTLTIKPIGTTAVGFLRCRVQI